MKPKLKRKNESARLETQSESSDKTKVVILESSDSRAVSSIDSIEITNFFLDVKTAGYSPLRIF